MARSYRYKNQSLSIEYLKLACDADPTDMYYLCMYAKNLMEIGDFVGASNIIDKATIIDPKFDFLIRIKRDIERLSIDDIDYVNYEAVGDINTQDE